MLHYMLLNKKVPQMGSFWGEFLHLPILFGMVNFYKFCGNFPSSDIK